MSDVDYKQVGPLLCQHYNSSQRAEITSALKLAVTLRYMAAGNSQVLKSPIFVFLGCYLCFIFCIKTCRYLFLSTFVLDIL